MALWSMWRRGASGRSLNVRFTDLADRISSFAGSWQITVGALALVVVWAGLGPRSGFSDSWQLWVNTPTTVIELFLGLFMLAAANRVEKRNYELHRMMVKILRHLEAEIDAEGVDLATEGRMLVRVEAKLDELLGKRG